jgi:5-methylcytosine-specific restriction endonuclease McrA
MSVPRPCLVPGCPRYAHGIPRCVPHQRLHKLDYSTRGYKATRTALLGLPCVACGQPSDTADHLIPLSKGGTWRDGLEPMCQACNSSRKDTDGKSSRSVGLR